MCLPTVAKGEDPTPGPESDVVIILPEDRNG